MSNYIKLRSINLQYYQETNDWVIIGEILDSGMSYEKPILVRTTEELDIWFGKDFEDYSYMQELINMGIVLYLYKPVSEKTTNDDVLSEYIVDDNVWLRDVELEWVETVLRSPLKYKFGYNNGTEIKDVGFIPILGRGLVVTENVMRRTYCTKEIVRKELLSPINQISRIFERKIKFHVYNSEDLWIYKDGEILNTSLLPQNLNLTSKSENNRDTIVISSPEDQLKYTYLDYNNETGEFETSSFADSLEDIKTEYIREIDPEKVATGYQTLMFSIEGTVFNSGDYFVIPDSEHGINMELWKLFYVNTLDNIPPDILNMFSGSDKKIPFADLTEFKQKLTSELGYTVIDNYFYSKTILPVTNFYKSENIKLIPETKITESVLSRYITPGIEVISKTIGRSSEFEDDLIKLYIEKINEEYRVIISRYTYSEVYEGTLKPEPGEEKLDSLITKQSKLIRCNFYGDTLRTGTFYLRGAIKEVTTPEMYKYSLTKMLSTEYNDPVYPDYFLIPDKYKYTSDIISDNPYQLFLDFSKEVECQFLIENKSSDELFHIKVVNKLPTVLEPGTYYKVKNIYYDWNGTTVTDPFFLEVVGNGGDFVFNMTNDEENRLVYFFKKMSYKYEERPGYYAYLRGVLLNDFYIMIGDILYKTPTQDAFIDYSIEKILGNYKSNFLVCDNQAYFYKNYQDGKSYTTTGWTRFIVGKVFREIQKNSGSILGQQMLGAVRSKITDIITSIADGFSIAKTIGITEFEPTSNGQSLKIEVETVMNDQVKNNVNLDITVNYNNIYGTIS